MSKVILVIAAMLALSITQEVCESTIYDTPQMIPIRKGTTYSAV